MSYVQKFLREMKEKPLDVHKELQETATPTEVATDNLIEFAEEKIGKHLPDSYKEYLKGYGNGDFYMLGVEPMNGISKRRGLGDSSDVLMSSSAKETLIINDNRTILLNQLVPVTYGGALELSNDHWAFICDKAYPDNDYPIGYVSQSTENVVLVLKNFEEWLRIFWEHNNKLTIDYKPVFHILFPGIDDREDILDEIKKFRGL